MRKIILTTIMVASPLASAQVLPSIIDCQVDYQFVKANVLDNQCMGCHTGAKAKAGVDLSTFSTAVNHLAAIESVVKNDEMPPTSSLTPEEAEIVLAWIAQGGQETAPAESACTTN